MTATYRDFGVVLRTYKLREADRIVVVMTEQHGKIRAVAHGVRKGSSRFGGRLEPLSHINLLVREGKELDTINQVETVDAFRTVREDLDRLSAGVGLLEAVDQITHEHEVNARLYHMLVGAIRALQTRPSRLLVPAFHFKLLAAAGVHPQLNECVKCESVGPLVAFDAHQGGALCRDCRQGTPMSADALDIIRGILNGELARVLAADEGPAVHEVDQLAAKAFEHHVERRLRAVHILDKPDARPTAR